MMADTPDDDLPLAERVEAVQRRAEEAGFGPRSTTPLDDKAFMDSMWGEDEAP